MKLLKCMCLLVVLVLMYWWVKASLQITEVFRDGTDEWIELYNASSQDFSWSLHLEGAKWTILAVPSVIVPARWLVLLWDKMEMISADMWCELIKDKGLSLSDTAWFSISLMSDTIMVDVFAATADMCTQFNNQNRSFIRRDATTIVASERGTWVMEWYVASPCILWEESEHPGSDVGTGVGSGDDTIPGDIGTGDLLPIWTGSTVWTGSATPEWTGDVFVPWDWQMDSWDTIETLVPWWWRGDVVIEEIYPVDGNEFGEYIVLKAQKSLVKKLIIEWLGQWDDEKVVDVSLATWESLYILDTSFSGENTPDLYFLPSITLTDGGELLTVRLENGMVLDAVKYTKPWFGKAVVFSNDDEDGRNFNTDVYPSLATFLPFTEQCVPTVTSVWIASWTIVLQASLEEVSPVYCDSPYTVERMVGTGVYRWCSIAAEVITWVQTVQVVMSRNDTQFCKERIQLFVLDPWWYCERDQSDAVTSEDMIITEIHATSDYLPEYIELYFASAFSGVLEVEGAWRWAASKVVSIAAQGGEYIVLSSSTLPVSAKTYRVSAISLTDGGEEIIVRGHDGQVIDSAVYTAALQWFSQYFSRNSEDHRIFEKVSLPSPGFAESIAEFYGSMPLWTAAFTCGIHLQHSKPVSQGTKVNFIALANESDVQNSSSEYSCERISDPLWYYGTGCNPSAVTLDAAGVYDISLTITNAAQQVCTATYLLNYPGSKWSDDTWDLTKPASYYHELYLKRKERFDRVKKTLKPFGLSLTTSWEVFDPAAGQTWGFLSWDSLSESVFTGQLHIVRLLPNPEGKDDGKEQIVLFNATESDRRTDTLVLFNWKTKKKLPPWILLKAWEEQTIEGTLWLGNQPGCLVLQDDSMQYDRFCYLAAGDNQWFETSYNMLAYADMEQFKKTSLQRNDEEFCMVFMSYPVLCKKLGFTADLVKQRKKDAKKYLSSEKKLTKAQNDLQTTKAKIKELQQKNKEQKAGDASKLKSVKGELANKKDIISVYKTLVRSLRDILYTTPNESIAWLTDSAEELITALEHWQRVNEGVVSIPTDDLEARKKASSYSLPLQYASIEDVRSYLLTETKNYISFISWN